MVQTRSSTPDVIPSLPRRLSSASPLSSFLPSPSASSDSKPPVTRNRRRYSFGGRSEDLAFDSPVTTLNQSVQKDISTSKNDKKTPLQRGRKVEKSKLKSRGIPLPPKKNQSNSKRGLRPAHDNEQGKSLKEKFRPHHDSEELNNKSKISMSCNQKASFLSGVNVHSQNIDFLSLPDPPSPTAISKSLRRKRRRSSPIFRSTPLKTITNEDNDARQNVLQPAKKSRSRVLDEGIIGSENHTDLVQNKYPTRSRSRSRRSLCHIASPSLNENESSTKRNSEKSETISANKKEEIESEDNTDNMFAQEGEIVLESDDEDDYTGRRSKGRRSMIIPKNFHRSTNNDVMKCGTERSQRNVNKTTENNINLENDETSKSVNSKSKRKNRKSIVLPSKERSGNILDDSTDYSIPNKYVKCDLLLSRPTKDNASLAQGKNHQFKQLVRRLTRLSPTKRILSQESIEFERLTGYNLLTSMEKVKRDKHYEKKMSSKTHSSSSIDISSHSTDNAFLAKNCRAEKQKLIMKMGPLVEMMEKKKKEEILMIRKNTGCRVQKKKGEMQYFCIESGDIISNEEYQKRYLRMIKKNYKAKMQLTSKEKSENCNKTLKNDKSENPTSYKNTNDIENPQKEVTTDSPFPNNAKNSSCVDGADLVTTQEINPYDLIPSKNEPSSDPEVAAAEKRLWSAIDIAMKAFTDEIFAITAARNAAIAKTQLQIQPQKIVM